MSFTAILLNATLAAGVIPPADVTPEVWGHLRRWEAVMKSAESFTAQGTKTIDLRQGPRKGARQYTIGIRWKSPNKIHMQTVAVPEEGEKPDPNNYETFIVNDRGLYEYAGLDRKLTESKFPASMRMSGPLLFDSLSGAMSARELAVAYSVSLVKTDDFYLYFQLVPRKRDGTEEIVAVLFRETQGRLAYLPRQAVVRRGRGYLEETWDFTSTALNPDGVADAMFDPAAVDPATWRRVVREPKPAADGNTRPWVLPMFGLPWFEPVVASKPAN